VPELKDKRLLIIGLDCAPPSLIFDRADKLPNLNRLMTDGVSGPLRSCDPPITIPAWMVMATGKDPGQLGLYGFGTGVAMNTTRCGLLIPPAVKEKNCLGLLRRTGPGKHTGQRAAQLSSEPVRGKLISCIYHPVQRPSLYLSDGATPGYRR